MAVTIILLGHVIAEFLLQPKILRVAKQEGSKSLFHQPAISFHVFIIFALTSVIAGLESQFSWRIYAVILCTCIAHYFIDYWKYLHRNMTASVFLIDQLLHIVSIVIFTYVFQLWGMSIDSWNRLIHMFKTYTLPLNPVIQMNILAISFVCLLWGTAYFISTVMAVQELIVDEEGNKVRDSLESRAKANARERHFGYMERLIILLFVLQNAYIAIAGLLLAKVFARFHKLKDEHYAEYFIYNTLLSYTCGLIFSTIYRYFLAY